MGQSKNKVPTHISLFLLLAQLTVKVLGFSVYRRLVGLKRLLAGRPLRHKFAEVLYDPWIASVVVDPDVVRVAVLQ